MSSDRRVCRLSSYEHMTEVESILFVPIPQEIHPKL